MSIKRAKNGKWYVSFRYKDQAGKVKQKKKEGLATKREAAEWEQEFRRKINMGETSTIDEIAAEYLADLQLHAKITTVVKRKWVIDHKILTTWGGQCINDISANDIRKWRNNLAEHYKTSTIRSYEEVLGCLYNWASRYYANVNNPLKQAGPLRFSHDKDNPDLLFWTREKYMSFIANVTDDILRIACEILFWTGCRRGELGGLTWADVDIPGKLIHIRNNYVYLEGTGYITTTPKTISSRRDIAIPQRLADELAEWRRKQYKPADNTRVIPVSPQAIAARFARAIRRQHIEPVIHLHSLRHSHASMLIEALRASLWARNADFPCN